MWHFVAGGLLMPAALPSLEKDKVVADPKFTRDGYFTMQVRGRVDTHLQNFIDEYFTPLGLEHSDIEYTPHMDYNVRFYCTHEDYAKAMYQAILDIDYLKFKPQAERYVVDDEGKTVYDEENRAVLQYKDGRDYHSVLNSIWSTVCRLGSPGGWYGAYSSTNPIGYKAGSYKGKGGTYLGYGSASESLLNGQYDDDQAERGWKSGWYDDDEPATPIKPTGTPFLQDDDLSDARRAWEWAVWPQGTVENVAGMENFTSERDKRVEKVFTEMMGYPEEQWEEYLSADQIAEVEAWGRDNDLPTLNLHPQAVVKEDPEATQQMEVPNAILPGSHGSVALPFKSAETDAHQHVTRKERREAERALADATPRHGGGNKKRRFGKKSR
jgi:hypothetical protein